MKENYAYIFDMDGTLYTYDRGRGSTFSDSLFYADLRQNIYRFLAENRSISPERAMLEFDRIKNKYRGEISLGIEQEFGIDRYVYFHNTWNLSAEAYIEKDSNLPRLLDSLRGRIALLTAAPRIWVTNVLAFLDITDAFGEMIYTGESDLRKPNPLVFRQITNDLNIPYNRVFSIGDQEHSDIIPAKNLGMKTVFIGSSETSADYQAENLRTAMEILSREGFL